MGSMALIRQFFYDLDWYSQGVAKNKDYAIEAAIENASLPKIWNSGSDLNFFWLNPTTIILCNMRRFDVKA